VKKANIDKILEEHDYNKSFLISILQDIQAANRWLPQETLEYVSGKLDVSLMDVYGLATFYKSFNLKPRGKHIITVCLGTACHVRGAPVILDGIVNQLNIDVGETTPDNNFTLEIVRCLGACALAPVVMIDGKVHGSVTQRTLSRILSNLEKEGRKAQDTEVDAEEEGN